MEVMHMNHVSIDQSPQLIDFGILHNHFPDAALAASACMAIEQSNYVS